MEAQKQPQFASLENVLSKLDKLETKKQAFKSNKAKISENKTPLKQQTVSDDFKVEQDKEQEILFYEQIIRKTLELFDINYDEIIRMDGKSAYNKAIEFYPNLLDKVKNSKCPPLTALNIAKKMEPYIEFTTKYGTSLEDIKQNLKQELNEEEKQKKIKTAKVVKQQTAKPVQQATMFSDVGNAITENKKVKEQVEENLASFFAR